MITKVSYNCLSNATVAQFWSFNPCPPTSDLDLDLAYRLEDNLGKDYETYLSDQPPSRAKATKVTDLLKWIKASLYEGAEVDADVEGTGGGEGHRDKDGGGAGGVRVWGNPGEDSGAAR